MSPKGPLEHLPMWQTQMLEAYLKPGYWSNYAPPPKRTRWQRGRARWRQMGQRMAMAWGVLWRGWPEE